MSNKNESQRDGNSAMKAFCMDGTDTLPPEEAPTMRSLALAPPSLASGGLGGPRLGFGGPPSTGLRRATPVSLKQPCAESGKSFGVKKEWVGVADAPNWEVSGDSLEPVPLGFPLERTHREIRGADATVVSARISKSLQLLSVDAKYDSKKAKAKCTTNDCVSFRIRLYAGGEGGQPVIVEVQRRKGSASSFMRTCRAVLDAAEGFESKKQGPPPFKKPIGEMKCLRSVKLVEDPVAIINNAIGCVSSLLRSKQRDTNILGLENLQALTDPVKTNPSGALLASKVVILARELSDIREELSVFLQRDTLPSDLEEEQGLQEHTEHARHLALCVLSNSLSLCSEDKCLEAALQEQEWFADLLVPSLVHEVKHASTSMNSAYEASICLRSIASCCAKGRHLLEENGAVEALQEAHELGLRFHKLLASETGSCIDCMK